MKALWLLLIATPAFADGWLASSPQTRFKAPDDAAPMANPPLSDTSDAVAGWELAADDAQLLVQRGVLDGNCALWTEQEQQGFGATVKADGGQTMKLTFAMTKTTMLASGTQQVNGTWHATALASTCVGPESFVITVNAHSASDKRAVARMKAIASAAIASLEAHGAPATTQTIPFGSRTIAVPAPAYPKQQSAPGMTMYSVPGTATVATLPESYTGDCTRYLTEVEKNYANDLATQDPDKAFLTVRVERTGDIVWRIAKQHAVKGQYAGRWYANITASTCKPGIAGSLLGISFDGASTTSTLDPAVVARVRRILAASLATLR